MNVRAQVSLEIVKDQFVYQLYLPYGASWEQAIEVAKEMVAGVETMAKQAAEAAQKQNDPAEKEMQAVRGE